MEITASHVTIRVTDVVRSERFYEVLGFSRFRLGNPDPSFNTLLEAPADHQLAMVQVTNGAFKIELTQVPPAGGGPVTDAGPRWHLALRTPSLEGVAEAIVAAGGAIIQPTRLSNAGGDYVMCADPDGFRILLIQAAAQPKAT